MTMIRAQRHLLLKRLDVLSAKLKVEADSLRADSILEEMRNIGKLLKDLLIIQFRTINLWKMLRLRNMAATDIRAEWAERKENTMSKPKRNAGEQS